ncbi:hypothetical protein IFO70_00020 [Phormidium tenue FACHB-886]|nr:hypothetical protein [Phormidium tenue FACHB-886]
MREPLISSPAVEIGEPISARFPQIEGHCYLTGRDAVLRFFQVMGYEIGRQIQISVNQTIYYQGFVATNGLSLREYVCTGKDADGKKIWDPIGASYKDGFAHLLNRAKTGDEIFYKINYLVGGIGNKAFVNSTDVFAEDDARTEIRQWENLAQFVQSSKIQPTAIVHSGGKSLHLHYRLENPVDAETWEDLAKHCCAQLDSDPAVTTLHRHGRLPGFPRRRKDGTWGEVALLVANDTGSTPEAFKQALEESWTYAQPFTMERWKKYTSAVAKSRTQKPIAPLSDPSDAFQLPDSVLFPSATTTTYLEPRSTDSEGSQKDSENPWEVFLNDELMPALEQMTVEEIFNEYPHDFTLVGSELVGKSPWSLHNSSGTSFQVNTKGYWYCWASEQSSQSPLQYLQLVWFGRVGRELRGRDFILFCKKLAAKVGISIPETLENSRYEQNGAASAGDRQITRQEWKQKQELERPMEEDSMVLPDLLGGIQYTPGMYLLCHLERILGNPIEDWICVKDCLYVWTDCSPGWFFDKQDDEELLRRIHNELYKYSYYSKQKKLDIYPFAKTSAIKEALQSLKQKTAVSADLCNPPGLNCTKGVLIFDWENPQNEPALVPHSRELRYLYRPNVEYNPEAPTEDCDAMLSALDPDFREVMLRTMASVFNLPLVRQKWGREATRAILACGTGSNGKDTYRAALSLLLGTTGMTSVSLADYRQYDEGRKFGVIPLRTSLVNWASENDRKISIDSLQSLKAAVTGELLTYERKGRDVEEFICGTIHIYNMNGLPSLKAAEDAIKTRFAPILFNKVFRSNPDISRGELKADPRFKDDPEFLRSNVLPAFLNRLIQAFKDLMREGIDYSCCDEAMLQVQIHNSHLCEWAQSTGLEFDRSAEPILIKDLWEKLESYYRETEVFTEVYDIAGGKAKRTWQDDIRPGDPYVKGCNQLPKKLLELYPQCEIVTPRSGEHKNLKMIKGLKFVDRTAVQVQPVEPPEPLENIPAQEVLIESTSVASTAKVEVATPADSPRATPPRRNWREGDKVLYKGSKIPALNSGQIHTLHSREHGMWSVVIQGSGRISGWIPPQDLELVPTEGWNLQPEEKSA